jgi:hypothetical protein
MEHVALMKKRGPVLVKWLAFMTPLVQADLAEIVTMTESLIRRIIARIPRVFIKKSALKNRINRPRQHFRKKFMEK